MPPIEKPDDTKNRSSPLRESFPMAVNLIRGADSKWIENKP
jgi:hypothetical protein